MDYAVAHQRSSLSPHLQQTLPKDTSKLTVHDPKSAAANSRRPRRPPPRKTQRPHRPDDVGQKLFFDTKYIKVPSASGLRYVIGFFEVFSGLAFTFNVPYKSDIYTSLDNLCKQLVDSTLLPGITIDTLNTVVFVSDQAGEFMGNGFELLQAKWKFVALHGAAYKHSDLGPIEGLWNRTESRVRSMYAHAPWMPHTTWPLAWDHAIWLHNRTANVHAGSLRAPPITCATGKTASLAHALGWGSLVIAHDAVEAPARTRSELGKMHPRGRLGFYVGFCDNTNQYLIYDSDSDAVFFSPWAISDTNDSVLRKIVSDFTPDDETSEPGYVSIAPPTPISSDLTDFAIDSIVNIGTVSDETDEYTNKGVVEFKQAADSPGLTSMYLKEFLGQAASITDAYNKLKAFVALSFVATANIYFPVFAHTEVSIRSELYTCFIVSTDARKVKLGFGLMTYEFDASGNVTVVDPHDAARADIRLLSPPLMSLAPGPSQLKKSSRANAPPSVPRTVQQAMLTPEWPHWKAAIEHDNCFYFLITLELTVFLLSNVDDYAIYSSSNAWYDEFERRYATTDTTVLTCESPLDRWCGQDLNWRDDGIVDLSQFHDIMATIDEMPEIAEMRPHDTPLESNFHSLSTPTVQRADTTSTPSPSSTAPDVSNSTRSSGGYENDFKRPPPQSAFNNCFTDSDWAADRTSRRSMSGFLIYMNNNLVSTGCKFHPMQCLSTMEAKYMGETSVSKDILFIDNLISELNPVYSIAERQPHPVQLFGDNNAALKFAEERTVNDRVKHIDLRHHFLMSLVDHGIISMNFVSTTDNIADLLTKPLSALDFAKFSAFIVGPMQPALRALTSKLSHANALRHKNL
jgi:hypothetical protein